MRILQNRQKCIFVNLMLDGRRPHCDGPRTIVPSAIGNDFLYCRTNEIENFYASRVKSCCMLKLGISSWGRPT